MARVLLVIATVLLALQRTAAAADSGKPVAYNPAARHEEAMRVRQMQEDVEVDSELANQLSRPELPPRHHINMKETPGHRFVEAAFKGDLPLMRNLVETQHVDPDTALDEEGEFAIHLAASAGHVDVLKYLIEELGQQVDLTDNDGITPLLTATWHGHIDAYDYLVSQGANPHHHCDNGWGVVMGAVRYHEFEMLKHLQDKGVLFHHTEAEGEWTPLMVAAAQGDTHIVKLLLENGADPLHMDSSGRDAIDIAENQGFQLIANLLSTHVKEKMHPDAAAHRLHAQGHETPHERPKKTVADNHHHHHGHPKSHHHHAQSHTTQSHRHEEL